MQIITGVERRRRWSLAVKLRIVAETERAGASVGDVARRYEISRGLLWNWRSQVRRGVLRPEPAGEFVPVRVVDALPSHEQRQSGTMPIADADPGACACKIEIRLADGTCVRVGDEVNLVTLRRVMAALRG